MARCLLYTALLSSLLTSNVFAAKKPHIIIFFIDDMGWNDVPWHNSSDYDMPNIRKMQEQSLTLNSFYTQHICSPSRAALLSGRYPASIGVQHKLIHEQAPYGVPLDTALISDDMKKNGYETHMVGKWHIGFCNWSYTPLYRGFDTHLGYYTGEEDYYIHNHTVNGVPGFDLRNQTDTVWLNHSYSTFFYGNETLRIIDTYYHSDQSKPLFLYLPFQAIHKPLEAPEYAIIENNISNPARRNLSGMSSVLDQSMGVIFEKLQTEYTSIWDNLLFWFVGDNGGPSDNDANSNYPLRGRKFSLWEGGVRHGAFVGGGVLNAHRRGQSTEALMHVTDIYATTMELIGAQATNQSVLDGISMLGVIQHDDVSPRSEMLLNVDPVDCVSNLNVCGALRMDNWKLVIGPEVDSTAKCYSDWSCANVDLNAVGSPTVDCGGNPPVVNTTTDCPYNGDACLYDLSVDPCEYYDVKQKYPQQYQMLLNRLLQWNESQAYPLNLLYPEQPNASNPEYFGGFWSPWLNLTAQQVRK